MRRCVELLTVALVLLCRATHAQTNVATNEPALPGPAPSYDPYAKPRVLKRAFRDYVILLYAAAAEPWSASWNDAGQMARFTNPTNGVTITSQFLQMPMDPALIQAAGDRDRFMDLALRKYCAALFGLTRDADISNQPIEIHSRTLGDHYFRYCEVWGRDREGRRRPGFFYIMLRGRAERPKFNGDSLILTIGYPELIDPKDQRAALKTFEVMLQNISFQ